MWDPNLLWRSMLALVGTAIAVLLIISIVGAVIGIPILLLSCKPLKDYIVRMINGEKEQCSRTPN